MSHFLLHISNMYKIYFHVIACWCVYGTVPWALAVYDYHFNYDTKLDYDAALSDLTNKITDEDAEIYWDIISNLLLKIAGPDGDTLSDNNHNMKDAERMLGYGFQSNNRYGYQQQQPVKQLSISAHGYAGQQSGYGVSAPQQSGYGMSYPQQSGYGMSVPHGQGYGNANSNQKNGYGMQQKSGYKTKIKKVFVPIVIRKKKQKKVKTISMFKGFYIAGGTQVFGKFKKLKDCKKSCDISPSCFAADYNPWIKKCYHHTNITACASMDTHPKLVHFKKIPCSVPFTQRGLITVGTHIFGGLEQKGIKSLQDCIKKCASAGQGIADTAEEENTQTCFAIDYDFATHKCYFHTDPDLCPDMDPVVLTPANLSPLASSINIILCPKTV